MSPNKLYNSRFNAMMTDAYQLTMSEAAFKLKKHETETVFDVFFRSIPWQGGFAVFAGSAELLGFLKHFTFSEEEINYLKKESGIPFSDKFLDYLRTFKFSGSIYSVPEGNIIFPNEPFMRIHGNITEIRILESSLLTIVNSASLWTTKAARLRLAVGHGHLMEFGMRRAQSTMAGYNASRYGYIGGFDSTSNVRAGMDFGIPVAGTQAHNWVQQFDSEYEAFLSYAEAFPKSVILLVDTYDTIKSGLPNAVKVFQKLRDMDSLPEQYGIRLDSGDLAFLSKEARKILDKTGFNEALIAASNDLDEYLIETIINQGGKISHWGVGTNFVTCQGNSAFGAVLKLAALIEDGIEKPKIKISNQPEKITLPGIKQIYRVVTKDGKFAADVIACDIEKFDQNQDYKLVDPEHRWRQQVYRKGEYKLVPLLKQIVKNGELLIQVDIKATRKNVREQINCMWPEYLRFVNPELYKVNLSQKLSKLKTELIEKEIKTFINSP